MNDVTTFYNRGGGQQKCRAEYKLKQYLEEQKIQLYQEKLKNRMDLSIDFQTNTIKLAGGLMQNKHKINFEDARNAILNNNQTALYAIIALSWEDLQLEEPELSFIEKKLITGYEFRSESTIGETPMGYEAKSSLTLGESVRDTFFHSTSQIQSEMMEDGIEEDLWACDECTFGNELTLAQC